MHEFEKYRAPSEAEAARLVREHPFAVIGVEGPDGVPVATHTPVLFDPSHPAGDRLTGARMLGHMAAVNDEWRMLERVERALVIFPGPAGYVSPTTYRVERSVPTWDYAAVHAVVSVEVVRDDEENLRIVRETVTASEALTEEPWDMTASLEVFRAIVGHVVGFRFEVLSFTSVFKLSQDKPEPIWRRVRDEARRRDASRSELADLMDVVGHRREG